MKHALLATVPVLIGIVLLPALLASGDPPPTSVCGIAAGPDSVILATIRTLESGGDYAAQARGASASGAYQFIDSTWNQYGGYVRAGDAPPDVQDAKASEMIATILDKNGGDVSAVPVVWYIGHLPAIDSPTWDRVPRPDAGNTLTPRDYQTRWLDTYHRFLADSSSAPSTPARAAEPGSCFGGSAPTIGGEWAFPGPRELIDANPAALTQPHHDYPAWDWIIPLNTPIYAVHGGTVTAVRSWPHNWWTDGCGSGRLGCDTCGIGLTITDNDGTRWTYCHGTNLTVRSGDEVPAGQQVMWSGNTGRSGTPHLHLEIRTADGARRDPLTILVAVYAEASGQAAPRAREQVPSP